MGLYTLKPTSVDAVGSGGDSATFRATVTVKNDGSESDSPLCGGGATLIDAQGRASDGDAVISESSAACEDLQPGLTATVLIDFRTAADAEPAVLELAPDPFADEESKAWTIP